MEISNLKLDIANILKNINVEGLEIAKYATRPDTFKNLPSITYSIVNESIDMQFRGVQRQTAIFQVDIWAKKGSEVSKILKSTKEEFLKNGIFFDSGNDVDDPSGLKRYVARFRINK